MASAPAEPSPLYCPCNPQASDLWCVLDRHFATFQQVYDERYQAKYGFWRAAVQRNWPPSITLTIAPLSTSRDATAEMD
jgi:hypothetical protein